MSRTLLTVYDSQARVGHDERVEQGGPGGVMGLLDKVAEQIGDAIAVPDLPDIDVRQLTKVVQLVWTNRDELVDLVTRLPTLLGDAGEQMQAAGEGAVTAGRFLTDDVPAFTSSAADALDACHAQLERVAGLLGELGRLLGSLPLIGDVASPVTDGLDAVSKVAGNLDEVALQLRGLGGTLASVGQGLGTMGGSLHGGGVALATLSGRPRATKAPALRALAAPTKKPSTKKPAAKKPAAKKPAAKKPAAKKPAAKKPAAKKPAAKKPAAKKPATRKKPAAAKEPAKKGAKRGAAKKRT
jgi:hypothetical protein